MVAFEQVDGRLDQARQVRIVEERLLGLDDRHAGWDADADRVVDIVDDCFRLSRREAWSRVGIGKAFPVDRVDSQSGSEYWLGLLNTALVCGNGCCELANRSINACDVVVHVLRGGSFLDGAGKGKWCQEE